MNSTNGNWRLGLGLALGVALMWGVLPIMLTVALRYVDFWTVTWWRFFGAVVVVGTWLAWRRRLPLRKMTDPGVWRWLVPTALALTANYVLYLQGLRFTSPTVAQTVIQIAPLLLLVSGVVIFREPFSPRQWRGYAVLVIGLLLFFNRRLPLLLAPTQGWGLGIMFILLAALTWVIYAVGQKKLHVRLSSTQVLWTVYVAAVLLLWPMAAPASAMAMSAGGWLALVACMANTILAYGAFGLALEHWEVSRVSAVIALAPLVTIVASHLAALPGIALIAPEELNAMSILGAICVVSGSIISAMGGRPAGVATKDVRT
ncbi:MAG: DMT family transporter [Gammaproteobacteria bacterium]|nr:DMT family transporter [Gammaproteobacteria bacterium]